MPESKAVAAATTTTGEVVSCDVGVKHVEIMVYISYKHTLIFNLQKKLKPCCACPETKKARDACIMENGEDGCGDLIEKHKQCMRDLGFKI